MHKRGCERTENRNWWRRDAASIKKWLSQLDLESKVENSDDKEKNYGFDSKGQDVVEDRNPYYEKMNESKKAVDEQNMQWKAINENGTHPPFTSQSVDFPWRNDWSFSSEYGYDLSFESQSIVEEDPNFEKLNETKITVDEQNPIPQKHVIQDPSNDLFKDFQTLLEKGDFTDVNITCGKDVIGAHKLILRVRSPVFAAMFDSPMQEREKNEVQIEDITSKVLRELLLFIYCGRISNLDLPKACDLLYAAEKYQIKSLKQICIEYLKSILSVENAIQVLQCADLYDKQLKTGIIAFISKHFSKLKLTEEWKAMQFRNPVLAVEVYSVVFDNTLNTI